MKAAVESAIKHMAFRLFSNKKQSFVLNYSFLFDELKLVLYYLSLIYVILYNLNMYSCLFYRLSRLKLWKAYWGVNDTFMILPNGHSQCILGTKSACTYYRAK